MKYSDYKEQQQHGTFNFPIAFYHKSPHSPNYEMPYHWHTYYEVIRIIFGTFHLMRPGSTGRATLSLSPAACCTAAAVRTAFMRAWFLTCRF